MATPSKAARAARSSGAPAAITSRDNRWLKEFRIALRGGLPTETGFVGVEGVRLVEEALRSGCPIEAVLFSESGERHHERLAPLIDRPEIAIPILRTSDRLFEGVADTEHPQSVAVLDCERPPRENSVGSGGGDAFGGSGPRCWSATRGQASPKKGRAAPMRVSAFLCRAASNRSPPPRLPPFSSPKPPASVPNNER